VNTKGLHMTKFLREDRPVLTVDTIVLDSTKKILLVSRKNPPYGWALPGGLVDHGEFVEAAAIRELQEETGLIAGSVTFFLIADNPRKRDSRFHAVSLVYHVPYFTGTAKAADDAKEVGWFEYKDILELDIVFDHKDTIKRFYIEHVDLSEFNA